MLRYALRAMRVIMNGSPGIPVDSIPAGMLGRIQRVIRRFHKSLEIEGVSVFGQPDADRNILEFAVFDGGTDALRNGHCPIHGGPDEQDGEFVPSVTIAGIDVVPDGVFDDLTNVLQDLVALQMTVTVIITLEMVEVDHHQGKRGPLTLQTDQLGL